MVGIVVSLSLSLVISLLLIVIVLLLDCVLVFSDIFFVGEPGVVNLRLVEAALLFVGVGFLTRHDPRPMR